MKLIFLVNLFVDHKLIADHKKIADNFNVFFANIGAKLSAGNNQSNCAQSYSDYLNNPTPHRFTLSTMNESYISSNTNKLKIKIRLVMTRYQINYLSYRK